MCVPQPASIVADWPLHYIQHIVTLDYCALYKYSYLLTYIIQNFRRFPPPLKFQRRNVRHFPPRMDATASL